MASSGTDHMFPAVVWIDSLKLIVNQRDCVVVTVVTVTWHAGLPSVSTLAELAAVQSAPGVSSDALFVLFFWAAFHPPSQPGGQMETLLQTLKLEYPAVQFIKVPFSSLWG